MTLTGQELAEAIDEFLAPMRCNTPARGAPGFTHCAACCYGSGWADVHSDAELEAAKALDVALSALLRVLAERVPEETTNSFEMPKSEPDSIVSLPDGRIIKVDE